MLKLKDICVNYSYKTVLTNVSLNFEAGKIYSLLGENGAGKSTLAHVLCGDILPTAGSIYLNEKKLKIRKPKDAIKNGIVCVHQRPLLAPSISIQDNLRIGISRKMTKQIPEIKKNWLPGRELSETVQNLSEQEVFNTSLSGALLKSPCVLILDEPPFLDTQKIRELAKSWSHKLLGIAQRRGSDESVQIITREIERIPAMDEQECLKTIQTFKDAVEQLHETETRQAGQETQLTSNSVKAHDSDGEDDEDNGIPRPGM